MPDRSEVEAVPREFAPVDFADAFIRVHPWHPCSNWMRSRLAGRGCESGDFCRRVLSDESWIFEPMRCSEPGHRVQVAIHTSRGPGGYIVVRRQHIRSNHVPIHRQHPRRPVHGWVRFIGIFQTAPTGEQGRHT